MFRRNTLLAALMAALGGAAAATAAAVPPRSGGQADPNDTKRIQAAQPAAQADAVFGLRLFQELVRSQPGVNVVCSPESVAAALGMAYEGAGGATRSEMAKALALNTAGATDAARHQAREALQTVLSDPDPQVTLRVANAVWVDRAVRLRPAFGAIVRDVYHAQAETLDLARSRTAAAQQINGWVSQKTERMIPEIIQPGDLGAAGAVLTNAIYFKGLWSKPFDKTSTSDQPFHKADGSTLKPVKMMHRHAEMGYLKGDGFQAVRLPFGGRAATADKPALPQRFSFYILLPDATDGLPTLVSRLDAATMTGWERRFGTAMVTLSLPRIKAEYTSEPNLNEYLKRLGIITAFSNHADFSALCDQPTYISQVKHKALVEVDEQGAKAAAATAVVMTRAAMPMRREVVLNADHPFVFLIRDDATGAVLFAGTVYDPQPV